MEITNRNGAKNQIWYKTDFVSSLLSRQQMIWKTHTLHSKPKTFHVEEKLISNRNSNSIRKKNLSILPRVSQVYILWWKMKEMETFTKIVVKDSKSGKFYDIGVDSKNTWTYCGSDPQMGVFRPSCSEVLGTLSANSRVEAANEHVLVRSH